MIPTRCAVRTWLQPPAALSRRRVAETERGVNADLKALGQLQAAG
jgi:hypothetical protein